MMVFTHILIGILLSVGISKFSTLSVTYFVIAGGVGGLLPDIDMLFIHRRTLHYPIIYFALSIILTIIYIGIHNKLLLLFVVFMAGAAAHSMMDVLGGGKEMRPWRKTDNRAVYNHIQQKWIKPLRIFYDGSLPDLLISIISASIILYLTPEGVDFWIILLVILAAVYTLLRRVITRWIPEDYSTFSSYIQDRVM